MAVPSTNGYSLSITGNSNDSNVIYSSQNSNVNGNGTNLMELNDLENRTTALENALENRVEYEHNFTQRIDNAQGINNQNQRYLPNVSGILLKSLTKREDILLENLATTNTFQTKHDPKSNRQLHGLTMDEDYIYMIGAAGYGNIESSSLGKDVGIINSINTYEKNADPTYVDLSAGLFPNHLDRLRDASGTKVKTFFGGIPYAMMLGSNSSTQKASSMPSPFKSNTYNYDGCGNRLQDFSGNLYPYLGNGSDPLLGVFTSSIVGAQHRRPVNCLLFVISRKSLTVERVIKWEDMTLVPNRMDYPLYTTVPKALATTSFIEGTRVPVDFLPEIKNYKNLNVLCDIRDFGDTGSKQIISHGDSLYFISSTGFNELTGTNEFGVAKSDNCVTKVRKSDFTQVWRKELEYNSKNNYGFQLNKIKQLLVQDISANGVTSTYVYVGSAWGDLYLMQPMGYSAINGDFTSDHRGTVANGRLYCYKEVSSGTDISLQWVHTSTPIPLVKGDKLPKGCFPMLNPKAVSESDKLLQTNSVFARVPLYEGLVFQDLSSANAAALAGSTNCLGIAPNADSSGNRWTKLVWDFANKLKEPTYYQTVNATDASGAVIPITGTNSSHLMMYDKTGWLDLSGLAPFSTKNSYKIYAAPSKSSSYKDVSGSILEMQTVLGYYFRNPDNPNNGAPTHVLKRYECPGLNFTGGSSWCGASYDICNNFIVFGYDNVNRFQPLEDSLNVYRGLTQADAIAAGVTDISYQLSVVNQNFCFDTNNSANGTTSLFRSKLTAMAALPEATQEQKIAKANKLLEIRKDSERLRMLYLGQYKNGSPRMQMFLGTSICGVDAVTGELKFMNRYCPTNGETGNLQIAQCAQFGPLTAGPNNDPNILSLIWRNFNNNSPGCPVICKNNNYLSAAKKGIVGTTYIPSKTFTPYDEPNEPDINLRGSNGQAIYFTYRAGRDLSGGKVCQYGAINPYHSYKLNTGISNNCTFFENYNAGRWQTDITAYHPPTDSFLYAMHSTDGQYTTYHPQDKTGVLPLVNIDVNTGKIDPNTGKSAASGTYANNNLLYSFDVSSGNINWTKIGYKIDKRNPIMAASGRNIMAFSCPTIYGNEILFPVQNEQKGQTDIHILDMSGETQTTFTVNQVLNTGISVCDSHIYYNGSICAFEVPGGGYNLDTAPSTVTTTAHLGISKNPKFYNPKYNSEITPEFEDDHVHVIH